ncbi:MAG: polysaccharide deacetylase family protein [Solirubrobacterales bacterium]
MSRSGLLAGASAAIAYAGPALAPVLPGLAPALGIQQRNRGPGVVLTFDDGPHPRGTPRILETLREAGAQATFFLASEQVERRPSLVAEIAAGGHGVALHCHRHRNQLRLTPGELRTDTARARALIEDAAGRAVDLYRPPYGIFSGVGLAVIRRAGLVPVLWSRWGRDWSAAATPGSVAGRCAGRLSDGDVLLLHDADHYSAPGSWRVTAEALPIILARVGEAGLEVAPLRAGRGGGVGSGAGGVGV